MVPPENREIRQKHRYPPAPTIDENSIPEIPPIFNKKLHVAGVSPARIANSCRGRLARASRGHLALAFRFPPKYHLQHLPSSVTFDTRRD